MNEYQRVAEQQRRDELVLTYLPLVKHVIGRLVAEFPPGVDVENLESAGVLGLVEAASKFDPTRNVAFKTFAYPRIRGAILDEMRRNSMFPQQILERIAAVRQAYRTLAPPVSIEALVQATGFSDEEVSETLANIRLCRMVSWEEVAEGGEASRHEPMDYPASEVEREELLQLMAEAIDSLSQRKRLLLVLYYREDTRLKEIAELVDLSVSRVSRLLAQALFEVREYIRSRTEVDDEVLARSADS